MTESGAETAVAAQAEDAVDDLVYGAPAMRRQVARLEVKALTLQSRRRAVRERFGDSGFERVHAALDEEAARLWTAEDTPAAAWLPAPPVLDVERAILRELFDDDVSGMVALVTRIAEAELGAFFRFLLKLGGPDRLLQRMSVALEAKVKPARVLLVENRPGFGVSEIHETVLPPLTCAHTAPAWATRALELAGARDVTMTKSACRHRGDLCCRYETRWR